MKKFSLKQIAAQSGLSLATIDRALHQRGNVHPQTLQRIEQAQADLELLQKASLAQGRTLWFDVVMHTPTRFSDIVRDAFISQIASFSSFRIQIRFHCRENMTPAELNALLKKCAVDSHGIILKALYAPALVSTIDTLVKQHVPVITLVTDIPGSARLRYIGMDNFNAGKVAALMMAKWHHSPNATIAAVTGDAGFTGEQERICGFQAGIQEFAPHFSVQVVSGGFGLNPLMYQFVSQFLTEHPTINAVYTVGGGNTGILQAFASHNREISTFISHDLDRENRALMQAGKIDVLIEHNLQLDAQNALRALLQFHHFIPQTENAVPYSPINIITAINMSV